MVTWEDEVEVHALHTRGWSISAIARHTWQVPDNRSIDVHDTTESFL